MPTRHLALLALLLPSTLLAASPDSAGAGTPIPALASLPPGLYLPAALSRTLHAGHTPANTTVTLRTTQRIPLGGHQFLPSNTTITATLLTSTDHPSTLTLQPISLTYRGQTVPLSASTLAIASFIAVSSTGIPANGSTDRGNPDPASWTTAQVGGGEVMRSGWYGPLINSTSQTVGSADFWGVYTLPPSPDAPPRALGPFSASARGLFGYNPACQLTSAPSQLTVTCASGGLILHHGDVLLLQVTSRP